MSNENWRKMPPEEFAKWAVGKTFRLYDDYATTYLVQSVELPLGIGIKEMTNASAWHVEPKGEARGRWNAWNGRTTAAVRLSPQSNPVKCYVIPYSKLPHE